MDNDWDESQMSSSETSEKTCEQLQLDQEINQIYEKSDWHEVAKVEARNILIIGKTRTGKSTIKNLLIDPRRVPVDIELMSVTRKPTFQSFVLPQIKLLLNIIDTPGVFERHSDENMIRSTEIIMEAIAECVNLEITKFHMVCFAFSMNTGIHEDDIKALKLFMDHFGEGVSKNSCLIVTRCESKTETQQEKIKQQLRNDTEFKKIAGYFKQGIFFTGSINYDDYNSGEISVIKQFKNILKYRKTLIEAFLKGSEPFQISQSCISDLQRIQEKYKKEIKILQQQKADGSVTNQRLVQQVEQLERDRLAEQQRIIKENEKRDGVCIIS